MRDAGAHNPNHFTRPYSYKGDVNDDDDDDDKHNEENKLPLRHMPCTIGCRIRCLWQRPEDANCFFWSMIIALKIPLPSGVSYDRVEMNESPEVTELIQKMRNQIVDWWYARPELLYDPLWRWMYKNPASFDKRESLRVVENIATATASNNQKYIDSIISSEDLRRLPRVKTVIAHLIKRTCDELKTLSPLIPFPTFTCLSQWSKRYEATPKNNKRLKNDLSRRLGTNEETGDDVPDSFKYVFAELVKQELQRERKSYVRKIRMSGRVSYFDSTELESIRNMDVGVRDTEGMIAMAAIHAKIIILLQIGTAENDEYIEAYGMCPSEPDMMKYIEWSDAKELVQARRAILLLRTPGHFEPMCPVDAPQYLSMKRLNAIHRSGHTLRLLRDIDVVVDASELVAFALMVATAEEIREHTPRCCQHFSADKAQQWLRNFCARCIRWWNEAENAAQIVSMHKKFGCRFVVQKEIPLSLRFVVEDDKEYVRLTDGFALETLKLDECNFKTWESVVGAANVVAKVIFVIRGANSITGYGGPSVMFKASWKQAMDALDDETGVCFFAGASTTDEHDFEITHVVAPFWQHSQHAANVESGSKRTRRSERLLLLPQSRGANIFGGGRPVECACGRRTCFESSQNGDDAQCFEGCESRSCTYMPLTLDEAAHLFMSRSNDR
jgi:hypothetical protein